MSKSHLLTGLAVGAALTAVFAASPAAKDSPLSALDYIEIQQLVNRYAFAIDNCTNNGYDYADLYTPDGVFYWGVGSRKSVGREQLAEAAGGGKNGCRKLEQATPENRRPKARPVSPIWSIPASSARMPIPPTPAMSAVIRTST